MHKTTATIKHRDFVPYGCRAIDFCDVNFHGYRAAEMTQKWSDIVFERFHKYNPIYEKNDTKIQDLRNQLSTIHSQKKSLIKTKPSRPFYRFWYNKDEKEKILEINKLLDELSKQEKELSKQLNKLETENKEIGRKRFFDTTECYDKLTILLHQNKFILTDISCTKQLCRNEPDILGIRDECRLDCLSWSQPEDCCTETEVWTLEE